MTEQELQDFLKQPATPCPETQELVNGLIEQKKLTEQE